MLPASSLSCICQISCTNSIIWFWFNLPIAHLLHTFSDKLIASSPRRKYSLWNAWDKERSTFGNEGDLSMMENNNKAEGSNISLSKCPQIPYINCWMMLGKILLNEFVICGCKVDNVGSENCGDERGRWSSIYKKRQLVDIKEELSNYDDLPQILCTRWLNE